MPVKERLGRNNQTFQYTSKPIVGQIRKIMYTIAMTDHADEHATLAAHDLFMAFHVKPGMLTTNELRLRLSENPLALELLEPLPDQVPLGPREMVIILKNSARPEVGAYLEREITTLALRNEAIRSRTGKKEQ